MMNILEELKKAGFRWHNQKKIWYAKNTDERLELAKNITKANDLPNKAKKEIKKKEKIEDSILLFGTKTCPNCKMAEKLLEKAKVNYKFVDAEENVELTKKYGVKQAPTLVIIENDKHKLIANLSNIKKHIEDFKI